LINSWNG